MASLVHPPARELLLLVSGALAIHFGANYVNTYFDFRNGVDDDKADDLTLVKGLLPRGPFAPYLRRGMIGIQIMPLWLRGHGK